MVGQRDAGVQIPTFSFISCATIRSSTLHRIYSRVSSSLLKVALFLVFYSRQYLNLRYERVEKDSLIHELRDYM